MRGFVSRVHGRTSKKVRITLLVAGILLIVLPVAAIAAFSDVPATHTHYAGISFVEQKGITTGYADGTFRPDNSVTRGQMATFLYRTSGALVAAGAHVNKPILALQSMSITRSFNNVNSLAPTFTRNDVGEYTIDFKFPVNARYIQVTPQPTGLQLVGQPPAVRWAIANPLSGANVNQVKVYTYSFNTTTNVPQASDCTFDINIF